MEQPPIEVAHIAETEPTPVPEPPSGPVEQPKDPERVSARINALWLEEASVEIVRATRGWIQYGTVGFAVMCIVIGAVEALFGR